MCNAELGVLYRLRGVDTTNSAAALSLKVDAATYEWAKVSTMVTSHIEHRPPRQGISVMPSGRFSSDLAKPEGSFGIWNTDGICAE